MRNAVLSLVVALSAVLASSAADMGTMTHLDFAERFAFATDRASLLSELPPESKAWFFYSVLLAQSEGRAADARALLRRYRQEVEKRDASTAPSDRDMLELWRCQAVLDFGRDDGLLADRSDPQGVFLQLFLHGHPYPHALRPTKVRPGQFAARWRDSSIWNLKNALNFADTAFDRRLYPLALALGGKGLDPAELVGPQNPSLSDYPGMETNVLALLRKAHPNAHAPGFSANDTEIRLTLDQLAFLRKELAGTDCALDNNEAYVRLVERKCARGADAAPGDPEERRKELEALLAFAESLAPGVARDQVLRTVRFRLLELDRSLGLPVDTQRLAAYVATPRPTALPLPAPLRGRDAWRRGASDAFCDRAILPPVSPDEDATLVRALLLQAFSQGAERALFADAVEAAYLDALVAESALLDGRDLPAAEIRSALGDARFRELRDRRELDWAPGNPREFEANAPVSLRLSVKNIPQVRVAIHDIESFNACRDIGAEVPGTVDLEGSVPTAERTLDFSAVPSMRRHTETIALPELDRPGLYVVEVSGGGLMSRALVRKGRLRVLERFGAAGHVFTVLGPDGAPAPDASLFLDGKTFAADKNGEIAIPFSPTDETVERTAILRSGRLACAEKFTHRPERYGLSLASLLPAESLVAGTEATLLLRPTLLVDGTAPASLSLLEAPVATLRFRDLDGVESVRLLEGLRLADDAECVVRFAVPPRLASLRVELSAKVRNVTRGRDETLTATDAFAFNGVAGTDRIEQAFLVRDGTGHRIELRGRNGEPVANHLLHLTACPAIRPATSVHDGFQTDADGLVALEFLRGVASLDADGLAHWPIGPAEKAVLPAVLTAAEGETFALSAPGYRGDGLPARDNLPVWVSLLERNALGETTVNRLDAVRQGEGDTLLVGPLPAGDYDLLLRALGHTVRLRVTRPFPAARTAGLLAGPARALGASGAEVPLRIAEAVPAGETLRVRLEGADAETRLHVVARRYAPMDADAARDAAFLRAPAAPEPYALSWGGLTSEYISGRHLGDEAQYILARRSLPHRAGNALFRPSLLLSPWSSAETTSENVAPRGDEAWEEASAATPNLRWSEGGAHGRGHAKAADASFPSFDFLRDPAVVLANLRPDKDGLVSLPLRDLGPHQDLLLLACDASRGTSLRLALPAPEAATKDLRLASELPADRAARMEMVAEALRAGDAVPLPAAATTRYQAYATVGDVLRLFQAIGPDKNLETFSFLSRWDTLPADRKRALYSEHACQELDFFLFRKDPAFFRDVVAPFLANKREPQFLDRWLLGEDLSAWTAPQRLGALDAFEQCLLAARHPQIAPAVARALRDEQEVGVLPPEARDRLFRTALRGIGETEAVAPAAPAAAKPEPQYGLVAEPVAEDSFSAGGAVMREVVASRSPALKRVKAGGAAFAADAEDADALRDGMASQALRRQSIAANRAADARRRSESPARAFFRPVDRTKEWVESDQWRTRRANRVRIAPNAFWADVARHIADGRTLAVLSPNVVEAAGSFPERMAALALLDVPFAGGGARVEAGADGPVLRADGNVLLFREAAVVADPALPGDDPVVVLQRFFDPAEPTRLADGEEVERAIEDEFVAGHAYGLRTILMNPTGRERVVSVLDEVPAGSIALTGGAATLGRTVRLAPYGSWKSERRFYFPAAAEEPFPVVPAAACERGRAAGRAAPFAMRVLAEPADVDATSWDAIAADGSDAQVLDYLRDHNLAALGRDLDKIAWRLARTPDKDESARRDAFFRDLTALLDERLVYDDTLWSYAIWRDAPTRVGEWLLRGDALRSAPLGLWFRSDLLDIDPEERDLFELKEYWPLVHPRAHPFGEHPRIDNRDFASQYRRFLDMLAYKPATEIAPRDHLLVAVYLLAQDRLDEARAHAALVRPADVRTRIQLDYLRAYLAYGDLDFKAARALAAAHDGPNAVPRWRDRFHDLLAACDEAEGVPRAGKAASRPEGATSERTLALSADGPGRALLSTGDGGRCLLRAYPIDIELLFSRNPFPGKDAPNRATFVRPVWESEVTPRRGETDVRVELPDALRRTGGNYVLEAVGADGGAVARLTVPSRELDAQLSPAEGLLRVRDAKGKPLPAAYVKVYARPAGGGEPRFHKDGYTDPRGVFDYANVSASSGEPIESFALLVLHDTEGAKTLEAPVPSALR